MLVKIASLVKVCGLTVSAACRYLYVVQQYSDELNTMWA